METWKKDWLGIMKMLKRNVNMKAIMKRGILYLFFCYLIASWGVNGVINPVHYYKNEVMQSIEITAIWQDDVLMIDLTEYQEKFEYLSFIVLASEGFVWDITLDCSGEVERIITEAVHQGLNSLQLPVEECSYIKIPIDVLEKNGAVLQNFVLSEYRKVDTLKMIEICLSLLLLLVFWECVQWIKDRYAK